MPHYHTLSEAVDNLKDQGYDLDFNQKGSHLECVQNKEIRLDPDDFDIEEFYRFEGMSNPSDMSVVYAVKSNDGKKGLLIDAYGAYADQYSAKMLQKLDIRGR